MAEPFNHLCCSPVIPRQLGVIGFGLCTPRSCAFLRGSSRSGGELVASRKIGGEYRGLCGTLVVDLSVKAVALASVHVYRVLTV